MACPVCGTVELISSNNGATHYYACGYRALKNTITGQLIIESDCGWSPIQGLPTTKCTCNLSDLMIRGCNCGQFQREQYNV